MENGGLISGNRPVIMVTNDDGIGARGLLALVHVLVSTSRYVVQVCAPDSERSAVRHCTYGHPLVVKRDGLFSLSDALFHGSLKKMDSSGLCFFRNL
ncbi:hypothetical protein G4B88_005698 [Cannabis sativa]|uniref:Survival protein SurE-like phosphatase/nucleotidase domain-containing protein n=1 Tax=Cannabis sativa TaxID=3483 RepID=A0A7J6DIZ0_CANSA|nr:hypothetical protein G4B88_005698 [Cannabis sativa]